MESFVKENKYKVIAAGVLVVLALLSFFVAGRLAGDPKNFSGTIQALDEKSETVMALTGAAAASSAAITLLPGDVGTPIADKLLDMSEYFMIILAAIFLEKWLVTITGSAAFMVLIPIALLGLAADVFMPNHAFRHFFVKVICFALVLFIAVPASVKLAQMVDDSYRASIDETIQSAEQRSEEIQDQAGDESDANVLEQIFKKVQGGVNAKVAEFKTVLSNFIESAAVLIVTSCVIPLAVMLFFYWIIKMLVGIQISIPALSFGDDSKAQKE